MAVRSDDVSMLNRLSQKRSYSKWLTMNVTSRYTIGATMLVTIAFVFHIFTIPFTPVVWSDEVCYNSITLDWVQHGAFYFQADPKWGDKHQFLMYGPVFFILNGLFISLIGNGLLAGRLLVMLAGIGVYIWYARALKRMVHASNVIAFIGLALLITDPFFSGALHKGRMDTLALLLYLVSVGIVITTFYNPSAIKNWGMWLLSAALFGLCLITTLRMALLTPPVVVLFAWLWWRDGFAAETLLRILIWGATALLFLFGWFYIAFHSLSNLLAYAHWANDILSTQNPLRWFRHPDCYPLFFVGLSAAGLGVIIKGKLFFNPLNVFLLAYIVTYYRLVFDTGPYVMLVLPAFYLSAISVAVLLDHVPFWSLFSKLTLSALLIYNIVSVGYRTYNLANDLRNRRYRNVDRFIADNIPPHAKVCADWVYYYAVLHNNDSLQLMFSYQQTDAPIVRYCTDTFNYDYLVVSKRIDSIRHHMVQMYLSSDSLQPVAVLGAFADPLLNKLSAANPRYTTGPYDGVIYKRIRRKPLQSL